MSLRMPQCADVMHIYYYIAHTVFALTFSKVTDKDVLELGENKQKYRKQGGN